MKLNLSFVTFSEMYLLVSNSMRSVRDCGLMSLYLYTTRTRRHILKGISSPAHVEYVMTSIRVFPYNYEYGILVQVHKIRTFSWYTPTEFNPLPRGGSS